MTKNVVYRMQDLGLAAYPDKSITLAVEMTAEEAEQIASVVITKACRISSEPLRGLFLDDPNSAICIDCRMHGTWEYVPHAKDCPYRVARRLIGLEDVEAEAPTITHQHLVSIMQTDHRDYEPYGDAERNTGDCSCGCRWFVELEGDGSADWGVCTNPASHRCGRLTFEHQGCPAFEYEYEGEDDE